MILISSMAILPVNDLNGADQASIQSDSIRDLNAHCPLHPPESLVDWEARAETLRLQVRVSLGLHPMPELSTALPVIHGRREMKGYSIEKVYFESLSGLFVTGSLYRPLAGNVSQNESSVSRLGESKKHPAVLYAHGHWDHGRFYEADPDTVRKLLATGAERFENAAINQFQAACVQLARMGCVVFQFDMLGYADSQQISYERSHLFGLRGDNPPTTDVGWPLFSARAEGYGQSVMGLQTLATLRSLEIVSALPDVDPSQVVITGASGGGTQSFIAAAIEPRIAGAFPAVMVSTGMQGGCTCENACGLRVDTGNVELAALIAPRPLGMTAADDWTKTMPEDGFPELKKIYGLYDKKDRVELNSALHFPHNYNHVSRVALYGWVNRMFGLGNAEPILESDFELLRHNDLTVWNDHHASPPEGIDFERRLLKQWALSVSDSLPLDRQNVSTADMSIMATLREGWTTLLRPAIKLAETIMIVSGKHELDQTRSSDVYAIAPNGKSVGTMSLQVATNGSDLAKSTKEPLCLMVSINESKIKTWELVSLNDTYQSPQTDQPLVKEPRPAAAYTYCYNAPQLVRRLAVMIAMVDAVSSDEGAKVSIVADANDAFLAAGAALLRPNKIDHVTIKGDPKIFQTCFAEVDSIAHPNFLPNSLRYGDLQGLFQCVSQHGTEVSFANATED